DKWVLVHGLTHGNKKNPRHFDNKDWVLLATKAKYNSFVVLGNVKNKLESLNFISQERKLFQR
ncbi:hypothetical protein HPP92_029012, partial [Vanilla planifolia]